MKRTDRCYWRRSRCAISGDCEKSETHSGLSENFDQGIDSDDLASCDISCAVVNRYSNSYIFFSVTFKFAGYVICVTSLQAPGQLNSSVQIAEDPFSHILATMENKLTSLICSDWNDLFLSPFSGFSPPGPTENFVPNASYA